MKIMKRHGFIRVSECALELKALILIGLTQTP